MQGKYRTTVIVVLLLIFLLIIFYNKKGFKTTGYNKISPQEAKKMMDLGEDLVILDVRTEGEYAQGHIKNSLLIDVQNLAEEAESKLTDKDQTILVYCRSGNRSAKAARILLDQGYKNVYDLGGINSWPYEVVR